MAMRDYREAGKAGQQRGRQARRRGGLLSGLLVGAFIGLAVAGALVWYLMPREGDFRTVETAPVLHPPPVAVTTPANPPAPPPTASTPPAAAPVAPGAAPAAGGNPNYTFYDILPGNQAPKPQSPVKKQDAWWLQVAALKSEADANALRARLILLGLDAVVQQARSGDSTLYRIRVGPFDAETAAQAARETLEVNNFEAKLLKVAVTH